MIEYRLRPLERELSFAVTPVDTFSGLYAMGGHISASIEEPHKPPLVKREGHIVFYDLPQGEYVVRISSDRYFSELLTARVGEGPYTVFLIPNRRYALTKGMTWIEGAFEPNVAVYVMPKGTTGLKLTHHEDGVIRVMTRLPWDLTNRHIAVGEDRELGFVKERLDTYTYKLSAPLIKQHEKNAVISPVSLGRTGNDGYLLCPIAGLVPEHRSVLLWQASGGEATYFREIKITYGRGNNIRF